MRWQLTLTAEIFRRSGEGLTETHLPQTIDRYASGERMGRIGQPSGQAEAISRLIVGKGGQYAGSPGLDLICTGIVSPAF